MGVLTCIIPHVGILACILLQAGHIACISRLDSFLCLCIQGWHLPNLCWNSTCAPLKNYSMYISELLKTIPLDSSVSISIHYSFITFAHCNHKVQHWMHSSFNVKHNIHRNRVHMTQSGKSTLPFPILPYSLRSKNPSLFTMKTIAYCSFSISNIYQDRILGEAISHTHKHL